MAAEIVVEFSDKEGRVFRGKSRDGLVSITSAQGDVTQSVFQADVNLQSWPSFEIEGRVVLFVLMKIGARVISTRRFETNKLRIDRGEHGHSLVCLVRNPDLREYFGSAHEHSV